MRRLRKRTLLLLIAAALIVPALVLALLSVKVVRDFADIGAAVRAEYGEYMARIASEALRDALLDEEQVNMVAARFNPPEGPGEVVTFLNRLQRENPLYALSFFVVPNGLVYYSDPTPGRRAPFVALPDPIRDTILASSLKQGNVPSGLEHLSQEDPGSPVQVTYFTVNSVDGDLLGVAGFVWDLDEVRENQAFLRRALDRRLREEKNLFQGAFFETTTYITLLDQNRRPVFRTRTGPADEADDATPVSAPESFLARVPLERTLPFYSIGVQMQGDRFDTWIRTVVRSSLAMIVVMFLVIVLALAVSLRFVLREIELAELKSSLVSNVSHELKTPLSLIRLFSETLQMGRAGSPEKEKEFLQVINKESERLTHLINNVLDVNRIEQGRKTYTMTRVDLAGLVEEILEAYRLSLKQQGFTLETRIAEDLPPVTGDPDALTQALINLMENAIKYSPDTKYLGITVEQDGDNAVLSVTDRGMGIPPGDRERVFDKFFRVERGLVHNVKGSGLGLSLVRHIVDAHGGRIRVESRLHEGSTFSMTLPLSREHAPDGAGGTR